MSAKLDKKIIKIRKSVEIYKDLDEGIKIDTAIKIKKDLQSCKKIITSYQNILENTEAHLSEDSPNDNTLDDNVLEEQFKYNMEQLDKIKSVLESNSLTIDEKISLFMDYTKYSNYIKEYLDKKREMVIKYL